MTLPLRPRWSYTDSVSPVDYVASLPQAAWTVGTMTRGGSDVSAAGVPAAFLIRRDHPWRLTLRFPEVEWPDVERMIAHGQAGGTLTLYPDQSRGVSHSLYLVSPTMGDDVLPRRGSEPSTYEIDITVRPTTDSVVRDRYYSDALFDFRGGRDIRHGVFTRAGAVGKYTDPDGVLQDAAANIPRTEWEYAPGSLIASEPTLLLESPAFTNLVDSDDLTSWTGVSSPTVTGSVSDPAGGTGAYTVEDTDGANFDYVYRDVTFTGDGIVSAVFVVRENTMPASGNQMLRVYDSSAAAARLQIDISAWSDGEPTVAASTGTLLGKRYVGNGYWAIYGLSTGLVAGNTNRVSVWPAVTAAQTGAIDVYRVYASSTNTPPWSILDASETKAAETLYFPYAHKPQAMSGLVDFRELEVPPFTTESAVNRRIMQIGAAAGSAPNFRLYRGNANDFYTVAHTVGGTTVSASIDLNPSRGDRIQLAPRKYADGSVQLSGRKQALGSTTWSAWTDSAASSALALAPAWSGERLYLGSVGSSGRGSQLFRSVLAVPGTDLTSAQLVERASK